MSGPIHTKSWGSLLFPQLPRAVPIDPHRTSLIPAAVPVARGLCHPTVSRTNTRRPSSPLAPPSSPNPERGPAISSSGESSVGLRARGGSEAGREKDGRHAPEDGQEGRREQKRKEVRDGGAL